MSNLKLETGSYRDPAGNIFYFKDKVLRIINDDGIERYSFLKENNLIHDCISNNFLIDTEEIENKFDELKDYESKKIVSHRKINYISYPYEWSFSQLKDAALHHLNFHIFLLNKNATLIDSSAYNIQFDGSKPIFIDLLSIKKYEEGEYWKGHKQFCENFLNPLILKSIKQIDFNNWFKGNLEGITTKDLNSILSFKDKISFNILTQVVLLNFFEKKTLENENIDIKKIGNKKFPKNSYISLLANLKNFISNLKIKNEKTIWDDYSKKNTYLSKEESVKKKIVGEFAQKYKFKKLVDLGCNDGVYSRICLQNGCENVIGFDYDLNVIDRAYLISKRENLNFLPLYFDASNPSSNHGWFQKERKGFLQRSDFDGLISLAFEHHLAIAKNIPINQIIDWHLQIAPIGLIEFVPKNDITIKKMLSLKNDIFPNYNIDNFRNILEKKSTIVKENNISESGRTIFEYSI